MRYKIEKICFLIVLILILTGCNNLNEKGDYIEKFMIGNSLEDGRSIHFTFDVPYVQDGTQSYVSDALQNHSLTIENFLNELEYLDGLWDGGSKLYQYDHLKEIFGKEKFYVLVCNSFENTKDIYVSKNRETLTNQCNIKIDDLDKVSMSIKENTLTRVGAIIIITDNSKRNNIYGESYRIDKKVNDKWIELETITDNYAWTSIGYTIDKNNQLEMKINWEWLYGKLEDGEYRLVKDTAYAGEGTKHYITTPFIIK